MVTKSNPTIGTESLLRNLATEDAFYPGSTGFDFAFGIGIYLDPRIGYYTANQIDDDYIEVVNPDSTTTSTKVQTITPLSLIECGF
jgi:hypothetical protein